MIRPTHYLILVLSLILLEPHMGESGDIFAQKIESKYLKVQGEYQKNTSGVSTGLNLLLENISPTRLVQYWTADYSASQRGWLNNQVLDSLDIKSGSRKIKYIPNVVGAEPIYQTNVEGKNGALYFDGTDDIKEATSIADGFKFLYFPDSVFTVGMILKIEGINPDKFFWIWDNLRVSLTGFAVRYDDRSANSHNNSIFLRIKNNNNSWITTEWQENIITPNVTHCLVFQWTGSGGVNCYVDSDVASAVYSIQSITANWQDASNEMHHGNSGWVSSTNPYEGWLFEFFVWDTIASISDIFNYYDNKY